MLHWIVLLLSSCCCLVHLLWLMLVFKKNLWRIVAFPLDVATNVHHFLCNSLSHNVSSVCSKHPQVTNAVVFSHMFYVWATKNTKALYKLRHRLQRVYFFFAALFPTIHPKQLHTTFSEQKALSQKSKDYVDYTVTHTLHKHIIRENNTPNT